MSATTVRPYTIENVQADIAAGLSDVEIVSKLIIAYAGRITTDQAFKGVATERKKCEATRATNETIHDVADATPTDTPTAPIISGYEAPLAKDIATKMIAQDAHVIFFPRGQKATKQSGWQNLATRDLAEVDRITASDPYSNVGIVGKADGVWCYDDDQNILAEYENAYGRIQTRRNRSVSGGTHLIFLQNDLSRAMGNLNGVGADGGETWSARVNNRYVLAAGSSAHPNNDPNEPERFYECIDDIPVAEAPASFIEFLKSKAVRAPKTTTSTTPGAPLPSQVGVKIPHGGIHNALVTHAGKLRQMGLNIDLLEKALHEWADENCEAPINHKQVSQVARSFEKYAPGKNTAITLSSTITSEPVTSGEEPEPELESDVVDSKFTIPESMMLASSVLGDIYFDVFAENGWPPELAFPALVTAASVLVPAYSSSGSSVGLVPPPMTSLYTALIGPVNCGKSQVTEWATKALGIFREIRGPHYAPIKVGSAEQMWKYLYKYTQELYPGENEGGVLVNPDEWSHVMSKANIPDASFSPTLTTAFYNRKHVITLGGQGGGKDLLINFPFSIIGGVVEEEFDQVFGAGTIGGLYDRMLFGRAPDGFKWDYRAFPVEAMGKYKFKPVVVSVDPSVYEVIKSWNKKDRTLGRITEVCSRVATILASIDGRPVVTGEDLEALEPLARYQQAVRSMFHPNPGVNPDAISANTILNWVKTHAQSWRTIRDLRNGTNASRKKLGPSVMYRSLQALAREGLIELWYSQCDGGGMLNPLPAGYSKPRPKIGSGLVKIGANA